MFTGKLISRFFDISKMVVFIAVINFVVIDAVVFDTENFLLFCAFSLNVTNHAPKIGVLGDFTPKMGNVNNITLTKHL